LESASLAALAFFLSWKTGGVGKTKKDCHGKSVLNM